MRSRHYLSNASKFMRGVIALGKVKEFTYSVKIKIHPSQKVGKMGF